MDIIRILSEQLRGFFSIDGIRKIISSGDYSALLTYEGITSLIAPILPLVLMLELVRGLVYRKFDLSAYRIPFFTYLFNSVIGRFISIGMVLFCIGLFERHAPFRLPFNWYGFILGYVIWEFAHFIYHFLAHKVRLFWCLHSTHHAPESMNLFVSHAHFFLEAPYADLIRTTICILLGVPPPMLFVIMFIDGTWGSFIHIGDTMMRKADLGVLGRFILTPSHHRVHHARNVAYMDTNYCNLLNIWDRIFRTYQPEISGLPIEYGITREMKKNSFLDAYFGEIVELARDVRRAPGLKNKFLYLFMPPGWSHTGVHKTAASIKKSMLDDREGMVPVQA
jgi:sterol desaturase/sphingolipid hydroxylase (fatty acid hydroxylase superfamily)